MAQVKNINMTPESIPPTVKLSQYDVGREIQFKLQDGSGDYTVPAGATITLEGTKPSGFGFTVVCTVSGSVATVVTTEGMTDECGIVMAELVVEASGIRIGSTNVRIDLERSPHPEGTTDGSAEQIIPALTLMLNEIEEDLEEAQEILDSMHDMSVEASPLDASEQPTVNYDPDENKLSFGIPRGYNGYEIEGTIGFADTSSDGDIVITMS